MNWLRNIAFAVGAWLLVKGRYEGAQRSTGRSYIHETVQSARFDIDHYTREEIVRKSRYFEKNNPILNRMADLFELYTVGSGLPIMPATTNPKWNGEAKFWLDGWSRYCDLTTRQSFGTLQSLMARTWFVDGEVFVLLTKGEKNHPRLQLIEGHRVFTPPELRAQEGKTVIDGVAIDSRGRPTGYYICEEDHQGRKTFGPPVPALSVIHIFEPSRASQYRGLPFVYPVINELHDLDDLHILEMKAAKDAAEITNVIKNETGELSPDDLRKQRMTGQTTINTGATVTEEKIEYYRQSAGGRTVVLKNGDSLDQHKSERPSVVMEAYWRYKTTLVCTGVGIPYVLVFPDSMQGTVYRGALETANAFFKARHLVIADAVARIYDQHVMLWAKSNVRQLQDPPADWPVCSIRPPRAVNVDIGRNSSAMLNELAVGATNYDLIYAPLGLDWRAEFNRLKEQQDYAASIGLRLGDEPASAMPPPNSQPSPQTKPQPEPQTA